MATVFIPAKNISKRIPHKNMQSLNGRPLICWTLDFCKKWEVVTEIVVATEVDGPIAQIAKQYGVSIYPLEESDINDRRTVKGIWTDFCKKRNGDQIAMQVTNPFRTITNFNKMWDLYQTRQYDVVISVGSLLHPLISADGYSDINKNQPPLYYILGSCWMTNSKYVTNCDDIQKGRIAIFPLSLPEAFEIDTPQELNFARIIASNFTND